MQTASGWAAQADRQTLKAYAAAIWRAMSAEDRRAFRQFIGIEAVREVMASPEEVALAASVQRQLGEVRA